jgi:hypothetical protein
MELLGRELWLVLSGFRQCRTKSQENRSLINWVSAIHSHADQGSVVRQVSVCPKADAQIRTSRAEVIGEAPRSAANNLQLHHLVAARPNTTWRNCGTRATVADLCIAAPVAVPGLGVSHNHHHLGLSKWLYPAAELRGKAAEPGGFPVPMLPESGIKRGTFQYG